MRNIKNKKSFKKFQKSVDKWKKRGIIIKLSAEADRKYDRVLRKNFLKKVSKKCWQNEKDVI